MVTYLLSVGFSSTSIGLMRTVSAGLEMSATWLAPRAMDRVGPLRSGLWSINWQIFFLIGSVTVFWVVESSSIAALGLVVGVVLSRVGLWGFDLSVQILVQQVCDSARIMLILVLVCILTGKGCWTRNERIIFIHGSLVLESLRTLRVCLHRYLRSPCTVPVSCLDERCRCLRRGCNLCWIFKEPQRPSVTLINVCSGYTSKAFQAVRIRFKYSDARLYRTLIKSLITKDIGFLPSPLWAKGLVSNSQTVIGGLQFAYRSYRYKTSSTRKAYTSLTNALKNFLPTCSCRFPWKVMRILRHLKEEHRIGPEQRLKWHENMMSSYKLASPTILSS